MRVLWFSNTPANAENFLGEKITGGGWLKSLDYNLQGEVDLHVAFENNKVIDKFTYLKTTYHPIYKKSLGLDILRRVLFNNIVMDDHLADYLKIIDDVKPDIIHVHGTENPFSCIIPHIKIPVVVSIQGILTVYHHKYFSGIESRYSRNRAVGLSLMNCLLNKSFYKDFLRLGNMASRERENLRHIRYIFGRTAWDRRVVASLAENFKYFRSEEILRESFYSNVWDGPALSGPLVLHSTTGNNFYKGLETIVEAALILKNRNISFIWNIAGLSVKSSIVKVVEKKLKMKLLDFKELNFLGIMDEEELVRSLKRANVYVMASHIENSPNNLCEAMILGLPCVATFAGGTNSILTDGIEGILVQDGDPWSVAGAIIEMFENYDKAKGMGVSARNRARNRHNKNIVITELVKSYSEIIEIEKNVY